MITINCKNKVAEQLMLNELMKHKDIEVSLTPILKEAKKEYSALMKKEKDESGFEFFDINITEK